MADIKLHNPRIKGKLKLPEESASKALQISASGELESSTVTNVELAHVSGVTAPLQSQINGAQGDADQALADAAAAQGDINLHVADLVNPHAVTKTQVGLSNVDNTSDADKPVSTAQSTAIGLKISSTEKGAVNGVATLDSNSLIPITQLPPAALERLVIVADQAARFALTLSTVQNGDTVKQTDTTLMYFVKDDTNLDSAAGYEAYTAGSASSVAWSGITGIPAPVSALTGTNTGDQTATTVPNTPAGSIAATDVQAAINELDIEKAPLASPTFTGTVSGITSTMVGLGNVDNTSDATKNAATVALTNKTIDADSNTISNLEVDNLKSGVLDTDLSAVSATHDTIPSAKAVKDYVDTVAAAVIPGDINPTAFAAANNQVAAADVTAFAFANGVVRSFDAVVHVVLNATTSAYEVFKLSGVQKAASWDMSVVATGDDSGVVFSITSSGQIQYTSANSAGFVSNNMKFRAISLGV